MNKLQFISVLIMAGMAIQAAGCTSQPSNSFLQTSIAGTLTALPTQPRLVVTQLVSETGQPLVSSDTPAPGQQASATASATPSRTPTQTQMPTQTVTAADTATPGITVAPGAPLYMTLQDFAGYFAGLTDLQKSAFAATLPGKTVSWYAVVSNITADGLVILKFPTGYFGAVVLDDVSTATALRINMGDQVEFTGTIKAFDLVMERVELVNVTIVNFHPEPTATETVTPTPGPGRR
jgi:hypothetical protein